MLGGIKMGIIKRFQHCRVKRWKLEVRSVKLRNVG